MVEVCLHKKYEIGSDDMSKRYRYSDQTYYKKPRQERPRKASPSPSKPAKRRPLTSNKKRKTKFFLGRIFFLIGFIVGVIYLIGIVLDTTQKPVISYQMVQRGMIDNSDVFDGLIVRDEMVVQNMKKGNMYLIAAEGDRVKKNGQVYQILDVSEASVLEANIENVESDIEKVQGKRQGVSYFQNEIQEINNNIDNYIEIYYMQAEPGQITQAHDLKKQLEHQMAKRKTVHMKDSNDALDQLKNEKEILASELRGSEFISQSLESGIISYYIDGYEATFTLDKLDQITEKDLDKKYENISTTSNQIIDVNEPAYRVIKANDWKVVSFIPESWASSLKVGEKHDFVLMGDDQREIGLKVEENIPQGHQHKIIFSSNEQLDLVADQRTISFKSLEYQHEGLKIPVSAIVERNLIKIPREYIVESEKGQGVLRSGGDTGENMFLGLSVQYEDDKGFAYILQSIGQAGGLKLGDHIVDPAKTSSSYALSEVSSTQGVYVVNGRITKFKAIQILAKNEDYVIVKPNAINGLKQFDQIVTNPKNIQEEQLLRTMDVQNLK